MSYSTQPVVSMIPGVVKKIVGSSTGGTLIEIDGIQYTVAEWVKKYLKDVGPGMNVMYAHEGTLLTRIQKSTGHAPVKAPSQHQEGTKTTPPPSETAKKEFGVSGTPDPHKVPPNPDAVKEVQKSVSSDDKKQRLIVRQSMMKVATDAWCCSNHEKQSFDSTLAEIIKGMKVLEEECFRDL